MISQYISVLLEDISFFYIWSVSREYKGFLTSLLTA